MINACVVSNDYRSLSPLYAALSASNTVAFTKQGSLDIDPTSFQTKSDVTTNIYACGPPVYGKLLVVNFIKVIAVQARTLVDHIFN